MPVAGGRSAILAEVGAVLFALALVVGVLPGAVTKQVDLPLERLVLANLAVGGTAVTDRTAPSQYEAMGQVVENSALNGNETDIIALYLLVRSGSIIPSSGTHELEIWVGEWNSSNDTAGTQVIRESFDVLGVNFEDGEIYQFEFSTPFSLDQTKDYAFEVWWTTDDASHEISWERDTGQGNVDGGFISEKSSGLGLPFDANPANNTDMFFAFATVPEPGSTGMVMLAVAAGLLRRRRVV